MHLLLAFALLSIPPVQSGEPNRQVAIGTDRGFTAVVFGSHNSIWFAGSRDSGRSFSSPVHIADVSALALGRHRGPRVIVSGNHIVVSAIFGQTAGQGPHAHGLPSDGNLVAWRSTDSGQHWSQPVVINDAPSSAREGLHAMAVNKPGEIAAVWLDLRSSGTRLFGAFSRDYGATWSKNAQLYASPTGTICQCCDPSIAALSDAHRFAIMFRNVSGGSRDMYTMNWNTRGGTSEAHKIGVGTWPLDACPMDGGGIARIHSHTVSAWRRDHTVYLAEDQKPEIALAEGKDVALAATPQGAYVAWTDAEGVKLHTPKSSRVLNLSAAGGAFPTLLAMPDQSVLAAWERDKQIEFAIVE